MDEQTSVVRTVIEDKYYCIGFARGENFIAGIIKNDDGTYQTQEGDVDRDTIIGYCFESEENARQYTPFEFTASEINGTENSEDYWQSFDEGIAEGIETLK
jgi:hypothetical protein